MEKCFAESGTHCSILYNRKCDGCTYRKTKKEFITSQLESLDRIKAMPQESFNRIANKYYSGKFNRKYESLLKSLRKDEQENAEQA